MAILETDATALKPQLSTKRFELLAVTAFISLLLLFLGGWLTAIGLGPWYYELEFPPFQPPAWLFTPVWTVVLSLLAWGTWRVIRQETASGYVALALALYGAQCVLNVGWSLLFFTLRRPDVALWELLALDVTLLGMIFAYARISRGAGLMLVPYLAWLLLSTAINGWIVEHNTPFGRPDPVNASSPDHDQHMREAIELAHQNRAAPFGSVIVDRRNGKIVASGVNQSSTNPTLHGEMVAIHDYSRRHENADWSNLTLYTTAEPCCMCQGAILWSGISEVVYGTSISKLKQLGWRQIDISAAEVVNRSWNPELSVTGGVLAAQCDELFRRND